LFAPVGRGSQLSEESSGSVANGASVGSTIGIPKTRKGRASRTALLTAARAVFRSDGFANARVSDIASLAGMSNGGFYRYFTDKLDVLVSLLRDLSEEMFLLSRSPWVPEDPTASVYETTYLYLKLYRDNADLFRAEIEAAQTQGNVEELWYRARKAFFDRITRALRRGQETSVVRRELDPELAAALLGGMTEHYAYLRFVLQRAPEMDIGEVSRQIAQIWAYGAFERSR
jgi:AcrR family transcriptional regulator